MNISLAEQPYLKTILHDTVFLNPNQDFDMEPHEHYISEEEYQVNIDYIFAISQIYEKGCMYVVCIWAIEFQKIFTTVTNFIWSIYCALEQMVTNLVNEEGIEELVIRNVVIMHFFVRR